MINEHSQLLIKKLEEIQQPDDITPLIIRCTLDAICETAMGVKVNALENPDLDYVKAITCVGEIMVFRFMYLLYRYDFTFYRTNLAKNMLKT